MTCLRIIETMHAQLLILKLAAGLIVLFLAGKLLGHLLGLDGWYSGDQRKEPRRLERKY